MAILPPQKGGLLRAEATATSRAGAQHATGLSGHQDAPLFRPHGVRPAQRSNPKNARNLEFLLEILETSGKCF